MSIEAQALRALAADTLEAVRTAGQLAVEMGERILAQRDEARAEVAKLREALGKVAALVRYADEGHDGPAAAALACDVLEIVEPLVLAQ